MRSVLTFSREQMSCFVFSLRSGGAENIRHLDHKLRRRLQPLSQSLQRGGNLRADLRR